MNRWLVGAVAFVVIALAGPAYVTVQLWRTLRDADDPASDWMRFHPREEHK